MFGEKRSFLGFGIALVAMLTEPVAQADGGVTFTDIAADGGAGIDFRRTPSPSEALWEELKQHEVLTFSDFMEVPTKSRGTPGIAIFDFDNDDDLDIYVTNGPGTSNSLYASQLHETGQLEFVDVAVDAGVAAEDQDGAGVCFGDIDNDGDHDLYVLGKEQPNRLFENLGNGTFQDITAASQLGSDSMASTSCSFGDVNGDGLLDVAVSNLFSDMEHRFPLMSFDFDDTVQHNQLFINVGDNVFEDRSASSGIQTVAGISWSLALVDYDLDGDVDLVVADDQAARPPAHVGGHDAGVLRLYENDGTGSFADITETIAGARFGAWMSLGFGDLNSDGNMDIFGSNVGDYLARFMSPMLGFPVERTEWSTGWFLGQNDGTLAFAEDLGGVLANPFGWGNAVVDYDNDGDQDLVYHGGMDMGPFVDASNPGVILRNDGFAGFTYAAEALAESTNHSRRNVQGLAVGDLNNDGFIDIVSVSNMDWPETTPLVPYFSDPSLFFTGPFDDTAFIIPTFQPIDPSNPFLGFSFTGLEADNGTLAVEVNSGANGNNAANIELLGTRALTTKGVANRDGIGAVVTFLPQQGRTVMKPVLSGGAYASSSSPALTFGMGTSSNGVVEVLWPGGVLNRLYGVLAGEKVVIPEIPCSFTNTSTNRRDYNQCVKESLRELRSAGVISRTEQRRLLTSALRAYGKPRLNPRRPQVKFEDASRRVEFSHLSEGGEGLTGSAWFDYNNDGALDLFLTNGLGHNNGIFRNNGDGSFTDVSAEAGIENGLGNTMALAGDMDNDGYPDLFLSSAGGMFSPIGPSSVRVYRNNRNGTFTDVTANSGVTGSPTSLGAAFGDINGDSYVDLFIAAPGSVAELRQDHNKLYLNNGDFTFTDISESTGVNTALGGCVVAFSDYDIDGDQDIFLGNCNDIRILPGPIQLFRNEGNLQFTDVTVQAGLLRQGAWMGISFADYDNDGDQDLFATNLGSPPGPPVFAGTNPVLYENKGDGTFADVDVMAGISDDLWGWGGTFTDFDNDGYADLFYTGSFPFQPFNITGPLANPGTLYINNGDGTFTNRDPWLGVDLRNEFTSGVAAGDFDNDGFSDILVAVGASSIDGEFSGERIPGHPVLLRNEGNSNNWITIRTVGRWSNRGGIGARVTVKAGDLQQTKEVRAGSSFLSTETPWPTFGLAEHSRVDLVEVHWPTGRTDRVRNLKAGQTVTIVEKEFRRN